MEKVFIKPTTREIVIKGAAADGLMDIFSYDPADAQSRQLGNLYIIGHVQHETDDMTYAINLISALAKREYYTSDAASPKEAFAATLKKINEVVEEFFEHKGVKINIGIFAVAGEQMYISKLGKFKVLLARDDKTIDVLNHISFDKEKVQEKQFSNVISGQVQANDRILAYYPSRTILARERYFKMYLTKFDAQQFAEQLQAIKKQKSDFGCAMAYINLEKVKEQAVAPRIQPAELAAPNLASAPARPTQASRRTRLAAAPTDDEEKSAVPAAVATPAPKEPAPTPTPQLPETKEISSTPRQYVELQNEVPRIIPTEFSLGTKSNFISNSLGRIRLSRLTPKQKAVVSLSAVALVIGVTFAVQYAFGINPQARETNSAVKTAHEQIELAKLKISQNDSTQARSILAASLASLTGSDSKIHDVRSELQNLLDELDQTQDAATSIVVQVPSEHGTIQHLYAADKRVYAYARAQDGADGKLVTIEDGSIVKTTNVTNTQPAYLTASSKGTPVIVDTTNQKTVAVKDSGPEVATFTLPQPFNDSYIYQDNLYVATTTSVEKFADVFKGDAQAKAWLKKEVAVPSDIKLMVVDGSVYAMTAQGTLITYYRGEKSNEVRTGLAVTDDHLLLTSADSPSLHLVDLKSGKIHILDKKTGTLLKTLKIGSQEPILTATVGTDGTLYFATSDNKIWKVVQ